MAVRLWKYSYQWSRSIYKFLSKYCTVFQATPTFAFRGGSAHQYQFWFKNILSPVLVWILARRLRPESISWNWRFSLADDLFSAHETYAAWTGFRDYLDARDGEVFDRWFRKWYPENIPWHTVLRQRQTHSITALCLPDLIWKTQSLFFRHGIICWRATIRKQFPQQIK